MIYSEEDKKSNILELQNYLYRIGLHDINIPLVLPDGTYGEKTQAAVRAIQREYGLPETGETDRETWDTIVLLFKHYEVIMPEALDIFPRTDNYAIRAGDNGSMVKILQIILQDLSEEYINIPKAEITGIYDSNTSEAVIVIQNKSQLPETGETDKYTWNSIVRLFSNPIERQPRAN